MIFTPTEAEQWAVENLYPEAGIEPAAVDMEKLYRAEELMAGIDGNARRRIYHYQPHAHRRKSTTSR